MWHFHCAVCVNNRVMSIVHLGICVLTIVLTKFSMLYILRYWILQEFYIFDFICIGKQLEDTKGVSWNRKSQDRQHNYQKNLDKRPNNYLQNTTHKSKYGATRTSLEKWSERGGVLWKVSRSCSTGDNCRVTIKPEEHIMILNVFW